MRDSPRSLRYVMYVLYTSLTRHMMYVLTEELRGSVPTVLYHL